MLLKGNTHPTYEYPSHRYDDINSSHIVTTIEQQSYACIIYISRSYVIIWVTQYQHLSTNTRGYIHCDDDMILIYTI